jgi:hypothetical protein
MSLKTEDDQAFMDSLSPNKYTRRQEYMTAIKKIRMYRKGVDAGANEAQLKSLKSLIDRWDDAPDEVIGHFCIGEPNVIGVNFGGMWIGIEQDGYAHS